MNSGQIIASGSVQQLLERFQLDLKVEINAEVNPEALEDCPGVTHVDLSSRRTCVYGNGEGFEESVVKRVRDLGVKQFAVRSADLEDVYLLATGRRYMRYSHGHLEKKQGSDSLLIQGKDLLQAGINESDIDKIYEAQKLFERATADTLRAAWAHYYTALADYRIANFLLSQGKDHKDQASTHLKGAVEHLKTVTRFDAEAAEAYALLSSVYGRQISLSPIKGILLGPRSSRTFEKAEQLAPDNPRVVLAAAIGDFNTPRMWGGNKEKAMEGFKRAATLFARERPTDPLQPVWGHSETYAWMGIAHLDQDQGALARAAFEKALEIDPNFGWVKYVLLPGLDKAGPE